MSHEHPIPKVDFYLLNQPGNEVREHFACRLLDKAYQQGHKVYVHTQEPALAQKVDDLLWSFREDGFIPHALADHQLELDPPIIIGHQLPPAQQQDILINLTAAPSSYAKQFKRVIEIVPADRLFRDQARQTYRHYRAQGFALQTHEL